jgi:hypothetical protein
VQQVLKVELCINQLTAKKLGHDRAAATAWPRRRGDQMNGRAWLAKTGMDEETAIYRFCTLSRFSRAIRNSSSAPSSQAFK